MKVGRLKNVCVCSAVSLAALRREERRRYWDPLESSPPSPHNHNRQDFSLGRNIVKRLNVTQYQGSI